MDLGAFQKSKNREGLVDGLHNRGTWKSQDMWGYDRRVYNQATVFFFTNFPDDWSYESMWRTFRKYGRVLDIYSPTPKSKSGSRFGFVRYLDVKNEVELERQLDQVKVGSSKLWVNRPRFRKDEERNRVITKSAGMEHVKPTRSYAEVVKGNHGLEANQVRQLQTTLGARVNQYKQQKLNSSKPSSQVWIMKNNDRASAGLEFVVKEKELLWLEGCYIGTAYSGGDKDEIEDLVETTPEWLGQWFEEIKPWSPTMVARERFVRFFDAWLEFPEFKEMVGDTWKSTVVNGWNGYCLKEKLKETKKVLKVWSKNRVLEIDVGIQRSIDSIVAIDKKGEVLPLSPEDIVIRRTNFLDLWKNQRIKEIMWRQNARKTWISEGDANSKFFHNCVKGRRRKNDIVSIMAGNERLEEVNKMKKGVANHFEALFKEEAWQRPVLDGIEFKKISEEERAMLEVPFNEEEVKQAVWNCESAKAPGPNGFNFKFIKEMWEVLKDDTMGFVTDFHKHGKLVRGINNSFIVLVPKFSNPQKIEEFKPISLVGVMYKVIAKLLACRLSSVLKGIIREN
ncbi:hypothetical protein SLEP1_g54507 [Rubroshorea leprosula]|uniref:RRM domain-containing protein n=1 Tax=Rubroshorea leprosula TaxID=152421 RepID=A0AAV5MDP7_9ROSI|nr:hypothetical protein SLEP1_g54507 [Rubroshorea leprosula]